MKTLITALAVTAILTTSVVAQSSSAPTVPDGLASSEYRWPAISARPASGRTSPSNARSVVVLPAPLGPRNPVMRP